MAVEGPESEDTDEQYQPEDEQYQSEPEDPDSESGDEDGIEPGEDEPVSGSCDFDDVDHGSVVPVGGPSVEPPSGLDSGVTQPAPPTAPEFPSPTAPGVGPQGLTGAEPSIGSPEAVPVDERPAAGTARPPRDNSGSAGRAPITVQNGAGRLLGESTDHDAALGRRGVGRQPISSQPRGKDVKAKRTLSRPRADVLASRETGSGGGATAGAGRWLLVFAMLLFAVALLGLAYAGLAASPEHLLLRTLASRVRSKGLSRSSTDVVRTPADRGGEKPTGIRYRD